MAEWEVLDNARRKGRRAYLEGIPFSANPMRAKLSRLFWEEAWKAEEKEMQARERILQERLTKLSKEEHST